MDIDTGSGCSSRLRAVAGTTLRFCEHCGGWRSVRTGLPLSNSGRTHTGLRVDPEDFDFTAPGAAQIVDVQAADHTFSRLYSHVGEAPQIVQGRNHSKKEQFDLRSP